MMALTDAAAVGAALGYIAGSVPFGVILTRLGGAGDIRNIGSGNIGATNVLRTGRKGLALATLVLDGMKGAAAIGACAIWISTRSPVLAIAGLAAVIGHIFPIWLRLKGGKGVATGLGVIAALCWPAGLASALAWLLMAKVSKISSVGALSAFVVAPLATVFLADWWRAASVLSISLLVFWRHGSNIRRLMAGTEPRIGKSRQP